MNRAFQPDVNDVNDKDHFPYRIYLKNTIISITFNNNSII